VQICFALSSACVTRLAVVPAAWAERTAPLPGSGTRLSGARSREQCRAPRFSDHPPQISPGCRTRNVGVRPRPPKTSLVRTDGGSSRAPPASGSTSSTMPSTDTTRTASPAWIGLARLVRAFQRESRTSPQHLGALPSATAAPISPTSSSRPIVWRRKTRPHHRGHARQLKRIAPPTTSSSTHPRRVDGGANRCRGRANPRSVPAPPMNVHAPRPPACTSIASPSTPIINKPDGTERDRKIARSRSTRR